MKRLYTIFLILTGFVVLSCALPRLLSLAFSSPDRDPFVSYSSVSGSFIVSYAATDTSAVRIIECDADGHPTSRTFTLEQRDSLLPEIYANQLVQRSQMPDTVNGQPIDMQLVRRNRWVFNSTPKDVNTRPIPVYPLMESMPLRYQLEDPELAFTIGADGIDIFTIDSMSPLPELSARFDRAIGSAGMALPPCRLNANITTRKGYDNGYLIIDRDGHVFQLKLQAGRPAVNRVKMPAPGFTAREVFVTEHPDKRLLGIVIDSADHVYVIDHETYTLLPLPLGEVDPAAQRLSIVKGLLTWTVKISDDRGSRWVALDSRDYSLLGEMSIAATPSKAAIWTRRLVPVAISFTDPASPYVAPRFSIGSPLSFFLWAIVICAALIITRKRHN